MITAVVLVVAGLVTVAKPWWGMIIIMAFLYFPLLPNIQVGLWETSVTAPLVLLLGMRSLQVAARLGKNWAAARYKWLLVGLGVMFLLVSLLSENLEATVSLLPNQFLYIVILFACLVLIRTPSHLVRITKVIMVLAFLLSIWRVELKPLRSVLGLPSLSINGAVFSFHLAFALCLVVLLSKGKLFSMFWRLFAALLLISIVYHGVLFQTRAGWLAWLVMLAVFVLRMRLGTTVKLVAVAGIAGLLVLTQFSDVLQTNWTDTQNAWEALVSEDPDLTTAPGDQARLILQEQALYLWRQRPITGWGPGFIQIFTEEKYLDTLGRGVVGHVFDGWLLSMVETGLLATLLIFGLFLMPVLLMWRNPAKDRDEIKTLCFAFAVGLVGLAVHLFFIDLLYSFTYFHVGLGLAAAEVYRKRLPLRQELGEYAKNAPGVSLSHSRS